jgi:tetratricopeptide (TPR) repeat protein
MTTLAARRADFAEHLFTRAICLPQSEREAFLRASASADPSIIADVLSMLHHFDRLSGFLESPVQLAPPPPAFESGQEIAGRFRIERFIARGGMGEVYGAYDQLLGEPVALKTIGAFDLHEQWLINRFREEIRLGRRVSHRNICRIYDIHEHSLASGKTLLFYAMELLEGETLAARMAREGPLPLSVAAPILKQVLSGLGEAHAIGVIHRDFKPANVILAPGRAVITDFGLAQLRIESASPALQPAGLLAGSLPYMAPEQFVNASVGFAADLFSVGVMMYEMVTGEFPFPAAPVEKALAARLSGTYSPPERWRRPIMKCLAADPNDRPKNVHEILGLIEGGIGRRTLILGGATAAAGAAYGIYRARLGMDVAPGMPVLLLDTRDERPGRVSSVVDQLLRTQLNQSAHFEVLARDRVALALERMREPAEKLSAGGRIAREVALREGAPLVISSFVRRSPHLRLEIQIEKLGSHPYFAMGTWSRSFPAESEPDLRSAASDAARWIRESVGEHADDLARRDRRPEEATTSSWEALLAYVEAEKARARGDDAEAIHRLRDALAVDEAFPLAHMRLAEFLIGLGQNDEGYSHWMRAARLVGDRRLSDRESFRIRALFLHDMWAYAEAAKIFADWAADFPNDYLPYFYLANCQKQMGRPDDALDSLNTAFKKAPGNPHVVLNRAQLHLEQGRPHSAKADLDSIREANLWWWQYMVEYHFVAGEYAAAWNCFNRLADSAPEWRSKSFSLKACLLFECGQDQNAMSLLRAGISYDRSHERLASNLPGKYLLLASGALRNRSFKIAADEARNAVRAGGEAMTLLRAAALLCETGDRSAAPEFAARAARAPAYPIFQVLRLRYEAALSDQPSRAIALLRDAQNLSPVGNPRNQLALALERHGFSGEAHGMWLDMMLYPARYWLEPYRRDPAVFRDAVIHAARPDRLHALDEAGRKLCASGC